MSAPGPSGFDGDTALEAAGDGRWRARVDPSWFVTTAPNGGFFAALATRALEAATGRPARSLTLHFLRAPAEGPVEVSARVERAGGTSSFVTLRMEQGGEAIVLGLGVGAEWREGQVEWHDAVLPSVEPPEATPPFRAPAQGMPPYFAKYEMRWAIGDFAQPAGPARVGAWIRAAGGRPLDAPLLAAMSDALMPPAFLRTGSRALVPTIDLTIHFRARVPEGASWALGVFESRVASGGVVEEDGQLFGEDGALLAQSRQLAILRAPAA